MDKKFQVSGEYEMKRSLIFTALIIISFIICISSAFSSLITTENSTLLRADFNDGKAEGWSLSPGWYIKKIDGNYALSGSQHDFAVPVIDNIWTDYDVTFRFNIKSGGFHFNVRYNPVSGGLKRYFIGFWRKGGFYLSKQIGNDFFDLVPYKDLSPLTGWHSVKVVLKGAEIKVYLDNNLMADYSDETNPIRTGTISIETLNDEDHPEEQTEVYFDDINVEGVKFVQRTPWVKLGGPIGGLGYDVRIDPRNRKVMFVTDDPSGVQKSTNGGKTWQSKNLGITVRTGVSDDEIPCFCLTMDPNNPDIVWTGMLGMKGIFKSTDNGETWVKKDNGVEETNTITFRGFAIKPGNSNIVLAAAEITTGVLGEEFDKTKGVIYRTEDGGEHWKKVWSGDNLARVLIFNPQNPDIVYCSTGIFDREAWNTTGVGILKSTDGGKTWFQVNNGLDNLFIGFLEMHPTNPNILFAGAGNNVEGYHGHWGGVYKTTDGGEHWKKVLAGDNICAVVISPSNPNIVYAGSEIAFYRSDDGGETWQKFYKPEEGCWGPPGVRAGFPISAVVDPNNPMCVFANNYGGGVFKSTDGGQTWLDASHGYTGANIRRIAIASDETIYVVGRSGPFRSDNRGESWVGLAYAPANFAEWNSVTVNPSNPAELIITDEFEGNILKSNDKGKTWRVVFKHPEVNGDNPQQRQSFRVVSYAPSNPSVVYAGMSAQYRVIDGDMPHIASHGMYKSTDGGESWAEINHGLENTDKNILSMAIHPTNPDIVYIGTYQDGIFKTTDGGTTWVPVSNGLGSMEVRSLAIDPGNPDVLLAGLGEGAGIYRTENGGGLWQPSNGGLMPECPSSLQRAGEVKLGITLDKISNTSGDYYSLPWSKITAIAFDPNHPNRVFAADERLGIFVSEDKGKHWVPLNDGLTMKAVLDLSISQDGQYLYAATEGAGVFRLSIVDTARVRTPVIPTSVEIATPSPTAICPTTGDPIAQPFGIGDVAVGGNTMRISACFPSYTAPVDLYLAIMLSDRSLFFFNDKCELVPEPVPWRQDTIEPQQAVLVPTFLIRDPSTHESLIPVGDYWFFSGVVPAGGGFGADAPYDFTYFKVTIDNVR